MFIKYNESIHCLFPTFSNRFSNVFIILIFEFFLGIAEVVNIVNMKKAGTFVDTPPSPPPPQSIKPAFQVSEEKQDAFLKPTNIMLPPRSKSKIKPLAPVHNSKGQSNRKIVSR